MSKSVTMSFSLPVELSIQIEECMENEKITRSELIKKALEVYLGLKESNKETNRLIREIHEIALEIRDFLKIK
jgi:metal-responsive CopG/Arc/MetJ family transcriptional regulator